MVFSTSFAHWSHTFVDGFHLGSSAGTLIAVARASQYRVFVLPNYVDCCCQRVKEWLRLCESD